MRYPDFGHEIRRLVSVTRFLGAPHAGEHLEFPLDTSDERELARVPALHAPVWDPAGTAREEVLAHCRAKLRRA